MGGSFGGIAGIVAGLGSVGVSIFQGERQKRAQKRAATRQADAQRLATARAASEQRRSEQSRRRANRKSPNITGLLGEARGAAGKGAGATTLTGAGGVKGGKMSLGQNSLLGS